MPELGLSIRNGIFCYCLLCWKKTNTKEEKQKNGKLQKCPEKCFLAEKKWIFKKCFLSKICKTLFVFKSDQRAFSSTLSVLAKLSSFRLCKKETLEK